MLWSLPLVLLAALTGAIGPSSGDSGRLRLRNVRQLTFGGSNSEPALSADGRYVLYEGSGGDYGTGCDQVYRLDLVGPAGSRPHRLSSGLGDTAGAAFAGPGGDVIYAASFHRESLNLSRADRPAERRSCAGVCQGPRVGADPLLQRYCASGKALWELKPDLDLFRANAWGNVRARLTTAGGFDGEPAVSPDGRWLVYTSLQSGDPDLWIASALDGSQKRRLTDWPGYEGRARFSADGRRLAFQAVRPRPGAEMERYRSLLRYNLVEPVGLRVYVMDLDAGGGITGPIPGPGLVAGPATNAWTPAFAAADGRRVVFSANVGGNRAGHYRLFAADVDRPDRIEPLTVHEDEFDAFPTLASDYGGGGVAARLIWASTRGAAAPGELNLFAAELGTAEGHTVAAADDKPTVVLLQDDPTVVPVQYDKPTVVSVPTELRDDPHPIEVPMETDPSRLHFPGEDHLQNVRQLTFGGQNAEGYFSFAGSSIVLQATGPERYGTHCDQIYRAELEPSPPTENTVLQRLSTGLGACTCAYFYPDDRTSIHAATFAALRPGFDPTNTCPPKRCSTPAAKTDSVLKRLCNTSYTWDLFPEYDIYKVNRYGNIIQRLTDTPGYDAEGAVSPDGRHIVFTSTRTGDPELWLMDAADGGRARQLTRAVGYDGGPFFSPDGTKVGFRASRPRTPAELDKYRLLLSYDLVEPLAMELYTLSLAAGADPTPRRVTALGGSNWAPFYLADNYHIAFSSNFNASAGAFGAFDLYLVGEDGRGLQRVTFNRGGFDAFPMQSRDGARLVWGSSRNGRTPMELNLFLADWVNRTLADPTAGI